MRLAIISDIHGNKNAFKNVLNNLEKEYIDKYIFVGDYYGELPYPNEVIDMIKKIENKVVISGNKETYLRDMYENDQSDWTYHHFRGLYWNYRELRNDNLDYLINLPEKKIININNDTKILLLHDITSIFKDTNLSKLTSSKYAEKMDTNKFNYKEYLEYVEKTLMEDNSFLNKLDTIDPNIIIFGHTHVQWHVQINGKTLINAGSCGLPLDINPSAPYTILDIESKNVSVTEKRIEYSIDETIEELKNSSLYRYAKVWCDIAINELIDGKDEITFFFRHVKEVSKGYKGSNWPLENKVWEKACESWIENESS